MPTTIVNAYSTLNEMPPLTFPHILNGLGGISDPEMAEHLQGFRGYVWSKSGGRMTKTIYHVMRHIERVRHQVTFTVDDEDIDLITPWGWEANAIFYLPDGTVRDPTGLILIDPAGADPEPGARLPYPPDAIDRKARVDAQLQRMNIYIPPSLPPVISAREVRLRSAQDAARRSLALFVAAVLAESLSIDKPISIASLNKDWPIAFAALSPAERDFVFAEELDQQTIVNFAWRYEALAVLQWALGLTADSPFPTAICNVPEIARIALACNSPEYVESARLRPVTQILDALDLHLRLNWAVTQARVDKRSIPAALDPGVIIERHHALNWLVRFEEKDWDDVQTPT